MKSQFNCSACIWKTVILSLFALAVGVNNGQACGDHTHAKAKTPGEQRIAELTEPHACKADASCTEAAGSKTQTATLPKPAAAAAPRATASTPAR